MTEENHNPEPKNEKIPDDSLPPQDFYNSENTESGSDKPTNTQLINAQKADALNAGKSLRIKGLSRNTKFAIIVSFAVVSFLVFYFYSLSKSSKALKYSNSPVVQKKVYDSDPYENLAFKSQEALDSGKLGSAEKIQMERLLKDLESNQNGLFTKGNPNSRMNSNMDFQTSQNRPIIQNIKKYSFIDAGGRIVRSHLSVSQERMLSNSLNNLRSYYSKGSNVYSRDPNIPMPRVSDIPVNASYRTGYASIKSGNFSLSAASLIKAILLHDINSDYPTYIRAKITSPIEIAGSIILIKTGRVVGVDEERITVQVDKIVTPSQDEYKAKGVIRKGLPGLSGSINRHIASRATPILVAAALIGYASSIETGGNKVNTSDAVKQSVQDRGLDLGVQEILKLTKERPNTVLTPAGEQFEILLLDKLEIPKTAMILKGILN